jgi:hypothetical protein
MPARAGVPRALCKDRAESNLGLICFARGSTGAMGTHGFPNLIVAAKLTLIGASAGAYLRDGVPRSLG